MTVRTTIAIAVLISAGPAVADPGAGSVAEHPGVDEIAILAVFAPGTPMKDVTPTEDDDLPAYLTDSEADLPAAADGALTLMVAGDAAL